MNKDTEDKTGVVTSILTRKSGRPVGESIIERAMDRADELKGQARQPEKRTGLKVLVRGDEAETPNPKNDLDLYVDDLERRLEVVEGRQTATLVAVGLLAIAMAVAGLIL